MNNIEIEKYTVLTYTNNTFRINLYLKDGNHAYLTDLDQKRARLLLDILRNEKPVYWNISTSTLKTGREPVGETEGIGPTPIDIKYTSLGGTNSFLGRPISREDFCSDGVGAFRHYEHGSIYWYPGIGAHEIHGDIRGRWASEGWERSFLGYPTSDELETIDGVRYNRFQNGFIVWTPESGDKIISLTYTDPEVDIEKSNRYFSNNGGHNNDIFYENMCSMDIDLRYDPVYNGWQFIDLWNGETVLNGRTLTNIERIVIASGQIILMQWMLRRLARPDRQQARINQITTYCQGCFKQVYGTRWHYNKWCSEFVSYLYRRAGLPVISGKRQHRMCSGVWKWEDLDWGISDYYNFADYFRDQGTYVSIDDVISGNYVPKVGDYLRGEHHSMMILGVDGDYLFYIHGNVNIGNSHPENKVAMFSRTNFRTNTTLCGVGKRPEINATPVSDATREFAQKRRKALVRKR